MNRFRSAGRGKPDFVIRKEELARENAKWGATLARLPEAKWPPLPNLPTPLVAASRRFVWRSNGHVVQHFTARSSFSRKLRVVLVVNVTDCDLNMAWDNALLIPNYQLRRLLVEAGFRDCVALEFFEPGIQQSEYRVIWLQTPALAGGANG